MLHLTSITTEAARAIKWSINPIHTSVSRGNTVETTLEFTTSDNFDQLSIDIVHELQGFVTSSPSNFVNVQAGHTYYISMKFSVSNSLPLGIFEGTLHIRNGKQSLPDILKIILEAKDQNISQTTIGTAGGTLMLNDGSSLHIPPSALSNPVPLSIERVDERVFPTPVLEGQHFEGGVAIRPSGIQFLCAITG